MCFSKPLLRTFIVKTKVRKDKNVFKLKDVAYALYIDEHELTLYKEKITSRYITLDEVHYLAHAEFMVYKLSHKNMVSVRLECLIAELFLKWINACTPTTHNTTLVETPEHYSNRLYKCNNIIYG
jgi:hypothetical protein